MPEAAPEPARPMKCPLPTLLANRDAPTWAKGETSSGPGTGGTGNCPHSWLHRTWNPHLPLPPSPFPYRFSGLGTSLQPLSPLTAHLWVCSGPPCSQSIHFLWVSRGGGEQVEMSGSGISTAEGPAQPAQAQHRAVSILGTPGKCGNLQKQPGFVGHWAEPHPAVSNPWGKANMKLAEHRSDFWLFVPVWRHGQCPSRRGAVPQGYSQATRPSVPRRGNSP